MKTLDIYDCELIKIFKSRYSKPLTVARLKEWWAWRCALPLKYVELKDIADHCLDLLNELNMLTPKFVMSLHPSENYCYTSGNRKYLTKGTKEYSRLIISRTDSLLSLTKVKNLPGYLEYYNRTEKLVDI